MAVYIIGYDLNRSGQKKYDELFDAIKNVGTWWHHLDSTWVVESALNSAQIRDRLNPHIGRDDRILIAKLSGEAAWKGFNQRGSDWLLTVLKRA